MRSLPYICRPLILSATGAWLRPITVVSRAKMQRFQARFSTISKTLPTSQLKITDYLQCQKTIEKLSKKGISELFPIQVKTFQIIYQGYDLIASDRTGSGKTLAFSLPVIERMRSEGAFEDSKAGPKFLIMAPTRELAVQISKQIQSLMHRADEIKVATLIGGAEMHAQRSQLLNNPHVIVATPGRFQDFYNRGNIQLSGIEVLCIDEADMMLEKGFKLDLQSIMQNIHQKTSRPPQHLLFSATMPKWVKLLTQSFMKGNKKEVNMIGNQVKTPNSVLHEAVGIEPEDRIKTIHYLIKQLSNQGLVLIFTARKIDADFLSKDLKIANCVLHGDIKQAIREYRLQAFKSRKLKVLIATDVAARGLDIPDVQLVIQNNPPENSDSYVHRSGRTGRAGKPGRCITIYNLNSQAEKQAFNKIKIQTKTKISQLRIEQQEVWRVDEELVRQVSPPEPQLEQQLDFYPDRLKIKLSKPFQFINYQAIRRKLEEEKGVPVEKITKSINRRDEKCTIFLIFRSTEQCELARQIGGITVTGNNDNNEPVEEASRLTRVIKFKAK